MRTKLMVLLEILLQKRNFEKNSKKIFFVCLVFCFIWQANAQTEFAPIGAEWYYTYIYTCCPESRFNHIISEKDTIIEGNNCRVIRQYYNSSNIASEKYIIKQEQGKVYYYYQDQFNLMFDFDAEVNDTVEFTFMYDKSDFSIVPYVHKDTILSARFKIEDITVNAQNLKTVKAKVLDEDEGKVWYKSCYDYRNYTYTEKIGFHSEFMPIFNDFGCPDIERFIWLRCYSDATFSFTSDEWSAFSLPCDYPFTTGINIPQDENIEIYPNPFNDNVFVFTGNGGNGGNIEIIDISGKIVYNSELSKGTNKISISHLPQGVYFVKIRNQDNNIQTFKIIKT